MCVDDSLNSDILFQNEKFYLYELLEKQFLDTLV